MAINNVETPGVTQLWASLLPWDEARLWYFPDFTRINNEEV